MRPGMAILGETAKEHGSTEELPTIEPQRSSKGKVNRAELEKHFRDALLGAVSHFYA
jgi:hypothetical protein